VVRAEIAPKLSVVIPVYGCADCLSVILAAGFVVAYFTANPYPGWTSLAVPLLVVGGFIIMSTGVAGLYIGKIIKQVKQRPLYVIDERVGRESLEQVAERTKTERQATPRVGARRAT
jgi:hypothetical protein